MIVKGNGGALEVINGEEEDEGAYKMYSPIMKVLRECNSFFLQGLVSAQGECRPLLACGRQVGVIRPDVACYLLDYPQVFTPTPTAFLLHPQLDSYTKRSSAVDLVLRDLRAKNVLSALRGWRDERFCVWGQFGVGEPLFEIERSAVTPLGIRAYGTHITGYTHSPEDGRLRIWVQKRAFDKPTYPGMMDSMVGGGVTAGMAPRQVMLKEAHEEAGIPEHLASTAVAAGCVSFFRESERGLHANTEFVYDLELPPDFVPRNVDGEVDSFEAVTVEEFLSRVTSAKYKLTSVPVALDFLIRRGFITPDTEPQYPGLLELLHVPLHHLYAPHAPAPTHSCPPASPPPSPPSESPSNALMLSEV
ncbi:uncharacterized protein LOC135093081 [Scylla paramamosain]|uniref:uncharacterized protein LOC135093081 n=1 Tax=Scylla paramamosain TaxID=85552 RepID=UPI00308339C3